MEMICRCAQKPGYVRIHTLAARLNVTPPSASKMAGKLRDEGLVSFERYGIITPTQQGWQLGRLLLERHDILQQFFRRLNQSEDALKLVEQIEHFVDPKTAANLRSLLQTGYLPAYENSSS